jgi:hypothetical protein
MAEVTERFGEPFRATMAPAGSIPVIDRPEDRELLREGYRKAGVLG